jgi:thiamine biosynthesis lipoprotein
LSLTDAAASTSGDEEQHLEVDGVRYSHIYDPRTGEALTGRRTVTVVARQGMDADALATAASVLGPEKGLALVEEVADAAALFVDEDNGRVRTAASARFDALPRVREASAGKD